MSFPHDAVEVKSAVAVDPETDPLAVRVEDVSVGLVVVDVLATRAVRTDAFFVGAADFALVM